MQQEVAVVNTNTDSTALGKQHPRFFNYEFFYKWGTLFTIIAVIVVFGLAIDGFLELNNILNILRSISIVTIIAIGMTVSLAVGGFDLSVGSVASVAGAISLSMFVWYCQGSLVAISVALLVALLFGLINAILVVKIKIPDMLLTLATMFIYQGVALTYTQGSTISQNMVLPNGEFAVGEITNFFSSLGKIPWIIIIMLVIVAVVHFFLTYTKHGRFMYMVGGNIEAARLSGVNVNKYRIIAYIISAIFAAIGGIVLVSRIQTAEINAGAPYLMDAVAAAYIGLSFGGSGKPNAIGTFVGAILIGILQNGLVMLSVPYFAMDIAKGLVLVAALTLTYYQKI